MTGPLANITVGAVVLLLAANTRPGAMRLSGLVIGGLCLVVGVIQGLS